MMTKMPWDAIWINAVLAGVGDGMQVIPNAAIAVHEGCIAWIGLMADLPSDPEKLARKVYDVHQHCITPGLIDCHTHIIYGGNRIHEFEMRLKGQSYTQIAKEGGGIQATVRATRLASEEDLFQASVERVKQLQASGVTTLEIKSGYGLNRDDEIKILSVAKKIEKTLAITIKTTYLGAHTIPPEYHDRSDDYIEWLCHTMLPDIASKKLADSVDVFCESVAFNLAQTEKVFEASKKYGFHVKCHAEQLSYSKSAALAAKYEALSADHLEHLSEEGVMAMAKAGTVAVLLPGAYYFLRETQSPPIDLLRKHHVAVAIASDSNPGTSPVLSLPLMMNMACVLFRLTPQEAFHGVTLHAAKALGLGQTHGSLTVGKVADLAIWKCNHPDEIAYYIGGQLLKNLIKHGQFIDL